MIKKALNIILLGWLINALVFFHPAFGDNVCIQSRHTTHADIHADNTLIDVILNHFVVHKSHKKDTARKIFLKARFLSVRAANAAALLSPTVLFDFHDLAERVCFSRFKCWEQKAFLPPHYNFLFRLSPF